jgi:hypothetical protein
MKGPRGMDKPLLEEPEIGTRNSMVGSSTYRIGPTSTKMVNTSRLFKNFVREIKRREALEIVSDQLPICTLRG